MAKRKSIKRTKALFGEAAATTIAAGVQAAAILASAVMSSKATKEAAKTQADSITQQSAIQAQALKDQNDNNNELQKKNQDYITQMNKENNDIQKTLQQNMLMAQGQEQESANKREGAILARNGVKKSLHSSLRAGSSKSFTITDGGGIKPLGKTQEGYNLYEIKGDTHNEYHKTKSGKYKTGVGFKFSDGSVIEGEGAPKGQTGELVLETPNNVLFISRHSLKGFNPTKAVKNGMNPMTAFNIQENIKGKTGIDNKAEDGGQLDITAQYPILQSPTINTNTMMKCGGRKSLRKKAWNGMDTANSVGSGITTTANIIGAGITSKANRKATGILNTAAQQSSQIMKDAYSNLKGIDLNSIDWNSYKAAHAMATTRDAHVNINPELAYIERAEQRRLNNVNRNTLSSVAAQSKTNKILTDSNDVRSRLYGQQHNMEEQIKQQNAQTLTQTSIFNAQQDNQSNQNIMNQKLALMQYNNGIENQKIMGIAGADVQGINDVANNNANLKVQNASTWGNALTNSANTIGSTIGSIAKQHNDYNIARTSAQVPTLEHLDRQEAERNKNKNWWQKMWSVKFGGRKSLKRNIYGR